MTERSTSDSKAAAMWLRCSVAALGGQRKGVGETAGGQQAYPLSITRAATSSAQRSKVSREAPMQVAMGVSPATGESTPAQRM